jgi:TonB family protein
MVDPFAEGEDDADGMEVQGTLGTIDQHAIQVGIAPRMQAVGRCFEAEVREKPYVGGQVALQFRVARDGSLKTLKLVESTLGSYEVERCILEEMRQASFERPQGGEAEFTYPLVFQGRTGTQLWDPGMVKDEILDNLDELLEAEDGVTLVAPEGLVVTFYVDRRGRVVSAGMTAAEAITEDFAETFIENLKDVKFVEPQMHFAKVTYTW